jgi:hypothetical protein
MVVLLLTCMICCCSEARKSQHKPISNDQEHELMFYNYEPSYTNKDGYGFKILGSRSFIVSSYINYAHSSHTYYSNSLVESLIIWPCNCCLDLQARTFWARILVWFIAYSLCIWSCKTFPHDSHSYPLSPQFVTEWVLQRYRLDQTTGDSQSLTIWSFCNWLRKYFSFTFEIENYH